MPTKLMGAALPAADPVGSRSTHSPYLALPPDRRVPLLEGIEAFDGRFGGVVRRRYLTILAVAQRRSSGAAELIAAKAKTETHAVGEGVWNRPTTGRLTVGRNNLGSGQWTWSFRTTTILDARLSRRGWRRTPPPPDAS